MKSEVFYDRLSSSEKLKNFEEPKKNRYRLVLASFLYNTPQNSDHT